MNRLLRVVSRQSDYIFITMTNSLKEKLNISQSNLNHLYSLLREVLVGGF